MSFWELSQPLIARLAEHLSLPGNPPDAVDNARDKQVVLHTTVWLEELMSVSEDYLSYPLENASSFIVRNHKFGNQGAPNRSTEAARNFVPDITQQDGYTDRCYHL